MEKEVSKNNVLTFADLIYEDIPTRNGKEVIPARKLNGVSGEMKSGEIYFVVTDRVDTKDAMVNILSGRIPASVKTYGEVLYNGNEREWSDWSRQTRVLNIESALKCLSFNEYLNREIEFMYPNLSKNDKEILSEKLLFDIKEITGDKFENVEISLIILHTLLSPEILIIVNYLSMEKDKQLEMIKPVLLKFTKEKNTTIIFADSYDNKQAFYVPLDICLEWGTVIQLISGNEIFTGKMENYWETVLGRELMKQKPTTDSRIKSIEYNKKDNLELKDKITACNNLDVSVDRISIREIKNILKKRLMSLFPYSLRLTSFYILLFFIFYCFNIDSEVKQHMSQMYESKHCKGKDAFYVAYLLFKRFYFGLTIILSFCFPTELTMQIDYSEEFVMRTLSPYNFLIARFLTYNLPSYLLISVIILSSWLIIFIDNINFITTVYVILISFVFIFLNGVTTLLIRSITGMNIFSFLAVCIYLPTIIFFDFEAISILILEKDIIMYLLYPLLIDPIFLTDCIFEVSIYNYACSTACSYLCKKLCFQERFTSLFYLYNDTIDLGSESLTGIKPEKWYGLVLLPESNLRVYLRLGLLLVIYIVLTILLGKRFIVPNVRLKLMKRDK